MLIENSSIDLASFFVLQLSELQGSEIMPNMGNNVIHDRIDDPPGRLYKREWGETERAVYAGFS